MSEYHREYRKRCKAKGLCTACRKRPSRRGQVKCDRCATRQLAYMLKLQKRRFLNRECRSCGRDLHPSIKMTRCPPCQEDNTYQVNIGRKLG